MNQQITYQAATISHCDFIGRTRSGICAVVTQDGVEVFRSSPHAKRIGCKLEVQKWLEEQAA